MATTGIIRSVGWYQAAVTVREQHRDDMTITTHPVETGAAISDHAFKNPAQLTVSCGSSAVSGTTLSDIYTNLLSTMQSATIVEVQTGKRLYSNMLIRSIATETDQTTENVMMITIQLQEIILVETQETTMPSNSVRSSTQSTSGVANTGTKSATSYSGTVSTD